MLTVAPMYLAKGFWTEAPKKNFAVTLNNSWNNYEPLNMQNNENVMNNV